MEISNCRSILFCNFIIMAAAMRNLNVKTVSKSVKYLSRYEFLKTSNKIKNLDCGPTSYHQRSLETRMTSVRGWSWVLR